jgi:hypothetical protein
MSTGEPDGSAPVATAPDSTPAEAPTGALVERCGWSLVWLGVLIVGLDFWGAWTSWAGATVVAPLLVVAGVAGAAAVWWVRTPVTPVVRLTGLVGGLLAVAVPQGAGIHARQFYTTDSAAFDQVAARALVHGSDPYTTSMAPASNLLLSPWQYWSYTVDGGHVAHVSYPAGSFLMEAAAMVLGFHHAVTDWVDLGAWLVTGVLLYLMLPAAIRWVSVLVLLTPTYTHMFGSGGTDALFLPFLVLAVWRWDRFAVGRAADLTRWIGPVALGVACTIKQTPWFCVPFLVIGVWLESRQHDRDPWRVAAAYLGTVASAFVVINLPFIVWQPSAWARGSLLPLTQPLVADGQGVVTLALHGLTGGVLLPLLTAAGVVALVALLIAYVAWFPRMRRVWLFALPLVLLLPARSLSSYLLDCFPAALVAAVTVRPAADGHASPAPPSRRWAAAGVGTALAGVAVLVVVAFASAPLHLSVRGFRTTDQGLALNRVTVTVHNGSDRPEHPHFLVSISGNHPTGFWTTVDGRPVVLGPGSTDTVVLVAPHYTWSPTFGSYWLVEAYTTGPDALSTSPIQQWKLGTPQS